MNMQKVNHALLNALNALKPKFLTEEQIAALAYVVRAVHGEDWQEEPTLNDLREAVEALHKAREHALENWD